MKPYNTAKYQACFWGGIVAALLLSTCLFAQDVYSPEVLCIIPWGDELGTLDDRWNYQLPSSTEGDELMWAAGQWVVNSTDELIILDEGESNGLLKFSPDGTLLAHTDMESINLRFWPSKFAVASSGQVLLGWDDQLRLLSPSLGLLRSGQLPDAQTRVVEIYPSDHGSFWIVYYPGPFDRQYFLLEYFTDGTMSAPRLLFQGSGFDDCDPCDDYFYVSPNGMTYGRYVDLYGFTYSLSFDEFGNHLAKKSPMGETVYTHLLSSDPGWTGYESLSDSMNYFFTWSGDFYTLHATEAGAVLTKYTLNRDPVCCLEVITQMPYIGPAPALIEFDASASCDPDEGDTLTYEWDFDGDMIFDEPWDDSYTGDPDHPVHSYYSTYIGTVTLRVSDPHDANSSCTTTVIVTIT